MPDGGVLTITTANHPVADAAAKDEVAFGDYVAIIVSDTGVGMTDEVARRAFEPFFTTKGPAGSGLGLSQVYGMARESGGTVRLMTSPGDGTAVTLLLPRADEMPEPARPVVEKVRAQSRAKVLVVDDNPDVLQVSADMLRQLGYCVVTAGGGEQALTRLDEPPAIVMLDYAMPGMTGLEVAAAMRARGYTGPIILATGYAELREAEEDELASLQGVLNKPYSISELEILLGRLEATTAEAGLQPVR
jgi:CheY-like chemotaxis protein